MLLVEVTASSIEVAETTADTVVVETPTLEHVEIGIQGPVGPRGLDGSSGNGNAVLYNFGWGDATPAEIVIVPAGKVAFKVEVVIKTAFDVVPTFSIGDSVDNSRLLTNTDIDAQTAGTYQTNPGHLYATQTPINLYLTPGSGTSTGNGLILIYIEA